MEDEKEFIGKNEHDPLADTAQIDHFISKNRVNWRIDAAKQKGSGDTNSLECLTDNTRPQTFEINHNVRQLGHVRYLIARSAGFTPLRKPPALNGDGLYSPTRLTFDAAGIWSSMPIDQ